MEKQVDLKKKLELLGEPTLPDRLSAEELFRRMDSGELILPEEASAQPETGSAPKVIPWTLLLRRGVPIAACLALVVALAQGGLWRMGSSGGAKFSENAAAPQSAEAAAADQAAAADDSAEEPSAEAYTFDADEDAPEPDPRAIAVEDAAEGEAAMDIAVADEYDDAELERQDSAENSPQKSQGSSNSKDSSTSVTGRPGQGPKEPSTDGVDDADRNPSTGGGAEEEDRNPPTGGGAEDELMHPDTGGPSSGEEDNWNPDSGTATPEDIANHEIPPLLWEIAVEKGYTLGTRLSPQLCKMIYPGWDFKVSDAPEYVIGYFAYYQDENEGEVFYYAICCSVVKEEDWTYRLTLISFEEWDGVTIGQGDQTAGGDAVQPPFEEAPPEDADGEPEEDSGPGEDGLVSDETPDAKGADGESLL